MRLWYLVHMHIHSLTLSYCRMLITFVNRLDPDQARQNIGPDLDNLMVFLKEFFGKVDLEKISRRQKSMHNFPGGKELNIHVQLYK